MTESETTPREKKLCVIAGNYQQAHNYARQAKLHPNDWFYPSDVYRMKGLRDYEYIRIGEWGNNPNIHDIDIELRIGNAKEVTCV